MWRGARYGAGDVGVPLGVTRWWAGWTSEIGGSCAGGTEAASDARRCGVQVCAAAALRYYSGMCGEEGEKVGKSCRQHRSECSSY